jgi:hypothetical protein
MRRVLMLLGALAVLSPLFLVPAPKVEAQAMGTGTALISWIPPNSYTDGTPLVVNQIKIYREVNGAQIWNLVASIPSISGTSWLDERLFNGRYCYAATATDFADLESVRSNSECKTVSVGGNIPLPNAPTLSVQ